MRNVPARSGLLALVLILSACGGGGSSGQPGSSSSGSGSSSSSSSGAGSSSSSSSGSSSGASVSLADASRLLEQSSFGPTPAAVAQVQQLGIPAYLDQQFATPTTGYSGFSYMDPSQTVGCPTGSAATCGRDNYSVFLLQMQFFRNALTGADQLRQRVAFALSQIMVVSGLEINQPYGMADYQNMLLDDAFGNYRKLLADVTLSPVMGHYLDMSNNDKPNPSKGTNPNENYAREINQLFSIGLVQLNADGTPKLDGSGKTIPTYDQNTVEGFSSVFTGWAYPPRPGGTAKFPAPLNYDGQMAAFPSHHDTGSKTLLNGTVLPAGQDQTTDLNQALDNIFNHPNVGPFIGKQLIQQLVTSNPSPAYVSRISAVFVNNGQGVRGDLKAVVRAILLDPEARGDLNTDTAYGKLREPVLTLASFLRGIGGATQSDGEYLRNVSVSMSQNVFAPGSVFNYYPPSYPLRGSTLSGPPFGIYDAATALTRANVVNKLLTSTIAPDTTVTSATGTSLDLSAWRTAAAANATLIALVNQRFFHGAMSSTLQAALNSTLNAIPVNDPNNRAAAALYLALASTEYQVEH